MLEHGWISRSALEKAVAIKEADDNRRLGEILVGMEAVDQGIVDAVLHIQEARKERNVGKMVDLVSKQTAKVNGIQDDFINGSKVKV